ncbi:hypothetical protein ACFO5O_07590 [Geojedonia litorea]|uniref:Vanadium chloroperoxidase N-terminal domain-containing protein n=1 Tax=Geojedonia litorea TaxID=1268269 RepID=A0ABV9N6I9_9FLAO
MNPKRVATLHARPLKKVSQFIIQKGVLLLISAIFLVISCAKDDDVEPIDNALLIASKKSTKSHSADMVLTWNKAMQDLYTFPRGVGTPPISSAYTWTLVHLAMHDALNSITPRYETYARVAVDKDADPDAAVAQAAYDVILTINKIPFAPAFVPQNLTSIHSLLETSLNAIPDGDAKTKGIALGHAVAQALMAKRASDLPHLFLISPNTPPDGTQPGEFRYIFLPPAPGGKGFAFPDFGKLQPFFMSKDDMYIPGPPYAVNSPEYASDFNEAKTYGAINSQVRTADQTEIGVFWSENSNRSWNFVARQVMESYNPQSQNAWKAARYFAVVHGAIMDAYISTTISKIQYYTWRPESAIHLADSDGNDLTVADPIWKPLLPTPPIPEYPSVLSFSGAAVGQFVFRHFGDRDNYVINQTSGFVPGVVRSFSSISDAVKENSLSSIYSGFHFRQGIEIGEVLGKSYGDYVFENALKEKN